MANYTLRQGYKKERLAVTNRIRGLLMEFGVVLPNSQKALRESLPEVPALFSFRVDDSQNQ